MAYESIYSTKYNSLAPIKKEPDNYVMRSSGNNFIPAPISANITQQQELNTAQLDNLLQAAKISRNNANYLSPIQSGANLGFGVQSTDNTEVGINTAMGAAMGAASGGPLGALLGGGTALVSGLYKSWQNKKAKREAEKRNAEAKAALNEANRKTEYWNQKNFDQNQSQIDFAKHTTMLNQRVSEAQRLRGAVIDNLKLKQSNKDSIAQRGY